MPEPVDQNLYNKIKGNVYKRIPKHSAYRSGIVVQEYKKKFSQKYGKNKTPYKGKKTRKKGISRWFDEKWTNQRGEIGYKNKNDVYRPSIRINKNTPTTFSELNKKQIKRARTEKYKKGRVAKFQKGGKWSLKYKKSINCKNPKGFSQKQHCKYGRKKGGAKTQKRKTNGVIVFKDYPDFTPNLTPREIFKLGSFGGTYWRPIKSKFFKNTLRNYHKKYPESWWKGIPNENLVSSKYDNSKNKYNVKVGLSLQYWESHDWIKKTSPYGWMNWYCDFYSGKRSEDDRRQITRWKQLTGPNGRFRKFLVTQILKKSGKWNDTISSPKIRQVLQHWGYKLTKADFDKELKLRYS